MEVKDSVLKQGWVEKKSSRLKQWRKRWLVLRSHSLSSYKSDNLSEKPSEHIQLAAILDVSPSLECGKEHAFRVDLKTQHYHISATSPDLMTEWLQQITFAWEKLRPRQTDAVVEKREKQKLEVSENLGGLVEVLRLREAQVQHDLDEAHHLLYQKASEEVSYIEQVHASITEVFQVFSSIYCDPTLPSQEKLKQLRPMASCAAPLQPDMVSEKAAHAYVNVQLAEMIVRRNVRILVENPSEKRARRTDITRALKWRYNGQRFDSLTFTISKAIELTAVGFCIPHKPNRITTLKSLRILQGSTVSPAVPALYVHPKEETLSYVSDESVGKIPLSAKIPLRGGMTYTICGQLDGASTYKCVQCLKQLAVDGVLWSFSTSLFSDSEQSNRTDVDCGPIADFYYRNL